MFHCLREGLWETGEGIRGDDLGTTDSSAPSCPPLTDLVNHRTTGLRLVNTFIHSASMFCQPQHIGSWGRTSTPHRRGPGRAGSSHCLNTLVGSFKAGLSCADEAAQ